MTDSLPTSTRTVTSLASTALWPAVLWSLVSCSGEPATPEPSSTPTASVTPATSATPGQTATPSGTPLETPPLETPTSPSVTPSSPTATVAPTETPLPTPVNTPSITPTLLPTATPSSSPTPPPGFGLLEREPNLTCKVEGQPGPPPSMALTRAFPKLTFTNPVALTHAPGKQNTLFVLEKEGLIHQFPTQEDVATTSIFLDIRSRVSSSANEMGLLGVAFHPDYATNGYLYVDYTADRPRRTVISRFERSKQNPDTANPASEKVLLEIDQPYSNHNGGMVAFGPDGYLYIGMGDGGSGGDPEGNGQDRTALLGKILRIDVDHSSSTLPYAIPADNPYATATDGSRPEIYAVGMRNPWRFSFDRVSGRLWVGDVGQDAYEEVDIIENGKNYGWNTMEGFHCFYTAECDTTGLTLPIIEYDHSEGKSITGGYVYRGVRLPELYGRYLYADYSVGRIWALEYDGKNVVHNVELLDSNAYVSSFGEDAEGEVYVVAYQGQLYRLDRTESVPSGSFPQRLSDTGCFDDIIARIPASGVYGYEVNSPLWSDGDLKRRWFALPDGEFFDFQEQDAWEFPIGTITLKDFYIEEEIGNPATERILETRLYVNTEAGWKGYTYKWNEEQTDAFLLEGSLTETLEIVDESGDVKLYSHYYPSRYDCQSCHTEASGIVLGLKTGQLNRDHDFGDDKVGGTVDNQLRTYEHIGLFSAPLPSPVDALETFPDPADDSAPLELRARAYLDTNCAVCHVPGGTAISTMDLRYHLPLSQTQTCNVAPAQGDVGVPGALILEPGSPETSTLALRMRALDSDRMPSVATNVVDALGVQVVESWILALDGCEE